MNALLKVIIKDTNLVKVLLVTINYIFFMNIDVLLYTHVKLSNVLEAAMEN